MHIIFHAMVLLLVTIQVQNDFWSAGNSVLFAQKLAA
jgi:hypothetical protein